MNIRRQISKFWKIHILFHSWRSPYVNDNWTTVHDFESVDFTRITSTGAQIEYPEWRFPSVYSTQGGVIH